MRYRRPLRAYGETCALNSNSQPWPFSIYFLIANPRLEIAATSTKERIGFESNRKKIAIFQMRFARAARLLDALDQADLIDYANNGCIDRRIWAADSSHRGEAFRGK